jgi:hypothetical protein
MSWPSRMRLFLNHRHVSASSVAGLVPGLHGAPVVSYDPTSLLDTRLAKVPDLRYDLLLVLQLLVRPCTSNGLRKDDHIPEQCKAMIRELGINVLIRPGEGKKGCCREPDCHHDPSSMEFCGGVDPNKNPWLSIVSCCARTRRWRWLISSSLRV